MIRKDCHSNAHCAPPLRSNVVSRLTLLLFGFLAACTLSLPAAADDDFDLAAIERERILDKAAHYLDEAPVTVTAYSAERSTGGVHDFYSEGDYWWPNPDDPEGPYIRRDGLTNPDNFVAHRRAMVRLSEIVGTLVSAYLLTDDEAYAQRALTHLEAWFVDDATRMNPSLLYGQAIKGRVTGRSIGIIDTIHLVEVARGVKLLEQHRALPIERLAPVKAWFAEYLDWLLTHPYGQQERLHPNNHGVCWSMQAAAFADLVGEPEVLDWVREQFRSVYLAEMMAADGSFPAELERTKPYGYSLFVLDAMTMVAQIASTEQDDLWAFKLPDGRGIRKGVAFLFPYMKDKSTWPYGQDVLYWDEWPVRHPSLLLAGLQFGEAEWLNLWKSLEADPKLAEVVRNLPVRHPLLWADLDRPAPHETPDLSESPAQQFRFSGADIQRVKTAIRDGDRKYDAALETLRSEAERALEAGPFSVTFDEAVAPSGDRHDYVSMAPYWWPDPDNPDGPYIRRDGEVNPAATGGDKAARRDLYQAVEALGTAYHFFGEEQYAAKAASLIRTWFIEPTTRMNPHMQYGQYVQGRNEGRPFGIIETRVFQEILDAVQLIRGSEAWTSEDHQALQQWISDYLDWLLTSEWGRFECNNGNNHETACNLQIISYALFADRPEVADEIFERFRQQNILQIEADGSQPREISRTKSLSYSTMNLALMLHIADLAASRGIDLYAFETEDGRSLKKAFDFLKPYFSAPESWPHQQITELNPESDTLFYILRRAHLLEAQYDAESVLQAYHGEAFTGHRGRLYWPPVN